MGNSCCSNENDKTQTEPYKFEVDWSGPVKKRKCTDILCFLLILVCWIVWGVVAYLALSKGDINRVSLFQFSYLLTKKFNEKFTLKIEIVLSRM